METFIKSQNFSNYVFEIFRSRASKLYVKGSYLKGLEFFQTTEESNFDHFTKIAHKVAKSEFFQISRVLISDKFSFQRCIICLCYFNHSQMNGGGTPHLLRLVICKIVYNV